MLEKIRTYLAKQGLDALLVPHSDETLGEYLTPDKRRLHAVTGFSGSAGMAVITPTTAVLFVDSRYTVQAKKQTSFTVFEAPAETTPIKWMSEYLSGKKVGFCAETISTAFVLNAQKELKKAKVTLSALDENPVDIFWTYRPAAIESKPMAYDMKYAGVSSDDKIRQVAALLKKQDLDAALILSGESVSWLMNERDLKNPMCPVCDEHRVVLKTGRCETLSDSVMKNLKKKKVAADFMDLPYALYQKIGEGALHDQPDMVAALKAVKNSVEIDNLRQACLFESQVICRFLAWVEQQKEVITELDCVHELVRLRSQNPMYVADSFDVIAASGPHAAQAHYLPTPGSSVFVRKYPLLLVDTGGQYLNGTTDMTRTICIGKPTPLIKKRYTQVLKGHIALATACIKNGALPAGLDALAHAYLRADGVDFTHATGHGIGMFSSVHETPPTIHEKSKTPLVPGMVFSNEPAYYDEGAGFGIRLENMLLSVPASQNALKFENLLFIPFDGRLVDFDMLTDPERVWLKEYHTAIQTVIFPALSGHVRAVLQPMLDYFL